MGALRDFFDFPWAQVAAFLTTLGLIGVFIGPRFKIVRHWVGAGLQEMFGITGLREDFQAERDAREEQHAENQQRFRNIEGRLEHVEEKLR